MKYTWLCVVVLFLASLSTAFPAIGVQAELDARKVINHSYQPVIPGVKRSPCPGTNTLANHGFINRNVCY